MQVGDLLLAADEFHRGWAPGRAQHLLELRRQVARMRPGEFRARGHALGLGHGAGALEADQTGPGYRRVRDQRIGDGEQRRAADEEQRTVEERQPPPNRQAASGHGPPPIRYPIGVTVSITGGSPSFARRRLMVIRTVVGERIGCVVPGAFEDLLGRHHRALRAEQQLEHRELLGRDRDGLPARVTRRCPASSSRSPETRVGGSARRERRASARIRATSSAMWNGLGR